MPHVERTTPIAHHDRRRLCHTLSRSSVSSSRAPRASTAGSCGLIHATIVKPGETFPRKQTPDVDGGGFTTHRGDRVYEVNIDALLGLAVVWTRPVSPAKPRADDASTRLPPTKRSPPSATRICFATCAPSCGPTRRRAPGLRSAPTRCQHSHRRSPPATRARATRHQRLAPSAPFPTLQRRTDKSWMIGGNQSSMVCPPLSRFSFGEQFGSRAGFERLEDAATSGRSGGKRDPSQRDRLPRSAQRRPFTARDARKGKRGNLEPRSGRRQDRDRTGPRGGRPARRYAGAMAWSPRRGKGS